MPVDARGIPTPECPMCGTNLISITAIFDKDTYEIGAYFMDAECVMCGCLLTAPTPLDVSEST